jgi:chorismate synthase
MNIGLVDQSELRCPDPSIAAAMVERIEAARKDGDSVGGTLNAVARNVPAGWGAPVYGKLDAAIAGAMLSIPAAKGVEIGSGFSGTIMTGSEHNDPFFRDDEGRVRTRTNNSGGMQAGISNGMPILVQTAFKPVATHFKEQETITVEGESTQFAASGRHDPCVLPRAVPIVEAMLLLCLADAALGARLAQI